MALELRAVDASWNTDKLVEKLASLSPEAFDATLRRAGIEPPKRVPPAAQATRRAALQIVASVVATAILPMPEPVPDVLDGLARDFMKGNPLLSYERALRLASFA